MVCSVEKLIGEAIGLLACVAPPETPVFGFVYDP